jgi:hypothetical protein
MTGIHNLPSEAVKAILALTREQLMELSAVNGQLYSVINSRPLNAKPLLRAGHLFYGVIGPGGDVLTVVYRSATMRYRVGKRLYGLDAAQSFPEQQWIRFNGEPIIALTTPLMAEPYPHCQLFSRQPNCLKEESSAGDSQEELPLRPWSKAAEGAAIRARAGRSDPRDNCANRQTETTGGARLRENGLEIREIQLCASFLFGSTRWLRIA